MRRKAQSHGACHPAARNLAELTRITTTHTLLGCLQRDVVVRMKLFECQYCGQPLYFENSSCSSCGHALGYLTEYDALSALQPEDGGAYRALAAPDRLYRDCANAAYGSCNWMVPNESPETFCAACR